MYDRNNVFAKIIRGEIPAKIIYESEHALSFYDISPKAPIHVLVIPKGFYENFLDFSRSAQDVEILDFHQAVQETAKLVKIDEKGFRIISNCGVNGGQEIPHYHVHLLGGSPIGPMIFN